MYITRRCEFLTSIKKQASSKQIAAEAVIGLAALQFSCASDNRKGADTLAVPEIGDIGGTFVKDTIGEVSPQTEASRVVDESGKVNMREAIRALRDSEVQRFLAARAKLEVPPMRLRETFLVRLDILFLEDGKRPR